MVTATATWTERGQWPWLRSQSWDYTFIIFSSVLVAVPLAVHYWFHVPTSAFNYIVAGLIGGPHMYSTFTLTFWERTAWQHNPRLIAGALLIPPVVVVLAIVNIALLITLFMAWASFHVLQQLGCLTDCYRERAGEPPSHYSRAIDYAVLFTSLYPIAVYKFATNSFSIGGEEVAANLPFFLTSNVVVYGVWLGFAAILSLWLFKTAREYVDGRLNYPKTMLIGIAVTLSFFIPMFDNLDVAFQGMNTWHSFQYIALIWYVNTLRHARGEVSNGFIRSLTGAGRARHFYLFHVALTVVAGGGLFAIYWASQSFGWGLTFQQCYFMVVLSFLLMHYYFDSVLFTRADFLLPGARGLLTRAS